MLAAILSGLSIFSGVASTVFGYLTKKADINLEKYKVDGQVDQVLVQADIQLMASQRDIILAQNQFRGYRYLHYLFGYPLGVYFSLILFTKLTANMPYMKQFSWDIDWLSGEQIVWASAIVGGLWLQSTVAGRWR